MQTRPDLFAALSDPTRLAIVERLARGEASAGELGAPLPISQPAVSRHLAVLERAGLVTRRIDRQRRMFRLAPHRLAETRAWLDRLTRAMETNYARLDALLEEEETPK